MKMLVFLVSVLISVSALSNQGYLTCSNDQNYQFKIPYVKDGHHQS